MKKYKKIKRSKKILQKPHFVRNSIDFRLNLPAEYGGPKKLEPTRYHDWENKGRAYDF